MCWMTEPCIKKRHVHSEEDMLLTAEETIPNLRRIQLLLFLSVTSNDGTLDSAAVLEMTATNPEYN